MQVNNNNVNFTARMDVKAIKGATKERWNNIAKIFNETTPKNDGYDFYVSNHDGELKLEALYRAKDWDLDHDAEFSKETTKELMSLSDDKIVKKFKKILNAFKFIDKEERSVAKFLGKMIETDKFKTMDNPKNCRGLSHYDEMFAAYLAKQKDDFKVAMQDDEILENVYFYGFS